MLHWRQSSVIATSSSPTQVCKNLAELTLFDESNFCAAFDELHPPRDLAATLIGGGQVVLSWSLLECAEVVLT